MGVGVRFAETTPESAQMDLLSFGRIQSSSDVRER